MLALVTLLLWLGPQTAVTLWCYQCYVPINQVQSCVDDVQCAYDEECFVERIQDDSLMVDHYKFGCVKSLFCREIANDVIVGKKRNALATEVDFDRERRAVTNKTCCNVNGCNKPFGTSAGQPASSIILSGGANNYEGTVMVFYNSTWGSVCDDLWSDINARIVCGMLGLPRTRAQATDVNIFHTTLRKYWMDDVSCKGNERSIFDCSRNQWGVSDCQESEQAGVRCYPGLIESRIRLVNGNDISEGSLQVYFNGTWASVCDTHWTIREAQVVCRMLGLNIQGATPVLGNRFNVSQSNSFMLSNITCNGNETILTDCSYSTSTIGQCGQSHQAGVICTADNTHLDLRLSGGRNSYQGTVEVFYNNIWRTVCDDGWTTNEAKVVCLMLGQQSYGAVAVRDNEFNSSNRPTHWMDDVVCEYNELSLFQCTNSPWITDNCNHGEQAGVICTPALFPKDNIIYLLDIKQKAILKMSLPLQTYTQINMDSIYSPVSFDYDPNHDLFYFYDNLLNQILRMTSTGTNLQIIMQLDFNSDLYSIKVDPVNGILFYTDDGLDVIGSMNVNGNSSRYVITHDLISPRGIAIEPNNRFIFWTDWGIDPKIETASYDGSNRRTLANTTLKWPNSITIDYKEQKLYFVDGGMETIECMNFDGSSRRIILQENIHLLSLDVLNDYIYFTARDTSSVLRVNKDGSGLTTTGQQSFDFLKELKAYKYGTDYVGQDLPSPLRMSKNNVFVRLLGTSGTASAPIEIYINGQWWTVCSSTWTTEAAKVACHMMGFDRYRAIKTVYPSQGTLSLGALRCSGNEDHILDCHLSPETWYLDHCGNVTAGATCENSSQIIGFIFDNFLVFYNVSTRRLIRMDLNTYSYTGYVTTPANFVPTAVVYDQYDQNTYVSEVNSSTGISRITAFSSRGDNVRSLSNIPTGSIINGLAIETRRNILFYSDSGNNRICSISIDGSNMRILASNIDDPTAITFDKSNLVIYWSSAGTSPKIEKIRHDGSDRQVIASTGLSNPNGIVVDPVARLIYFCDSVKQTIEVMATDGTNRSVLFADKTSKFSSLTLTPQYIFYTDLNKRTIMRLNKDGTNQTSVGPDDFPTVYGIYAYVSTFT